jgi:hypothetical protein
MATNPHKRQAPKPNRSVIQWLLDSDPSIRWQAMRDLIGAPAEEVAAERARVATEGAGARLLALQGPTGRGLARRGTAGGTPRRMSCRCCEYWVSIPRATRRVVRWAWSATA